MNIASQSINKLGEETADISWIDAFDGVKLLCRRWLGKASQGKPENDMVILYLPGIEGHGRWFEDTALFLTENGITTYALDRRGSGLSEGLSGHLDSYKALLADIERSLAIIRTEHKSSRIFLMANCWSAKAAIVLISESSSVRSILSGLILTSPAVHVKVDVSLSTKLNILFRYLTASHKTIAIPLEVKDFTDNPYYMDYINKDNLRLKEATAQFFVESCKLSFLALSKSKQMDLPLLLLQAGQDSIVEVNKIRNWFENVQAKDKTMRVFNDIAHSLDFAEAPEEYRQTLLKWLYKRCAGDRTNEN